MSKITTRSGFFAAPEANKVFSIADRKNRDAVFNRLWIYPASGVNKATSKLVANAGNAWIGERTDSGEVTPDLMELDSSPLLIELPQGQSKKIDDVLFQ